MEASTLWLANPVSGNPAPPPGLASDHVNSLWSYVGWGVVIVACFVAAVSLITAMVNHQQGRPNDGFGKLGVTLACCFGFGMIGGIVGVITGT